jgi:uncharacterized membrane protein
MSKSEYTTERTYNNRMDIRGNNRNFDLNDVNRKRSHFILPPPAILDAYENLSPGATERLMSMAEQEQKHRHNWEDTALRSYVLSNRLGKMCGALVGLSVVFSSTYLALSGDKSTSLIIAITGFTSLTVSSLVTLISRKFERKPRKLRDNISAPQTSMPSKSYN